MDPKNLVTFRGYRFYPIETQLWLDGMTQKAIAEKVGCSNSMPRMRIFKTMESVFRMKSIEEDIPYRDFYLWNYWDDKEKFRELFVWFNDLYKRFNDKTIEKRKKVFLKELTIKEFETLMKKIINEN